MMHTVHPKNIYLRLYIPANVAFETVFALDKIFTASLKGQVSLYSISAL